MKSNFYLMRLLNLKVYLLSFSMFYFFSPIQSQIETSFSKEITEWTGIMLPGDAPTEYVIPVSGLPTQGFTLSHVSLQLNREAGAEFSAYLIIPNGGGTIFLGTGSQGSFPTQLPPDMWERYYIQDCSDLPPHNGTPKIFEEGEYLIQPEASFGDLSGINLNGDWKIYVSSNTADTYMGYFILQFTSAISDFKLYQPNLSADCQTQSDVIRQVYKSPCAAGVYYSSTDNYSSLGEVDKIVDRRFPVFLSTGARFPNWYQYTISEIDASSNIIAGTEKIYDFKVEPINYSTSGANHSCKNDAAFAPGEYAIEQLDLTRNCDVVNSVKLEIVDPKGGVVQTYDPWNTIEGFEGKAVNFNYIESGVYQLNWTVNMETLENGALYDYTCTQKITIEEDLPVTFTSALCGDPTPQVVTNCASTANSQFYPIEVSGLPSNLSTDFGLRGVRLDLNLTDFSTQQPYVDIVDPTGFRHRVFNPQTFPQFDGSTQSFKVYITTCNSVGIPRANDDVPFVEGGTYRPMIGSLNVANQRGIDPNGTWQLQNCASVTSWSINCFELDFGNMCAALNDYTFGQENCQTYIQVKYSDITDAFCDDMNEDGLPDYYIGIDGGPVTTWDAANNLKMFVSPGTHTLEFGELQYDENGDAIFACRQYIDIDAPDFDTENPTLADCPTDATLILDASGAVTFDYVGPTYSDNCGIKSSTYTFSLINGATDASGASGTYTLDYFNGLNGPATFNGPGQVVVTYDIIDNSDNTATCTHTYTLVNANPCDSDTELPIVSGCPSNQTIMLGTNGEATFQVTNPGASDNCGVASLLANWTFLDGATDQNGNTMGTGILVIPGTFPYTVVGTGRVVFEFYAIDNAGNESDPSMCRSTITVLDSNPCDSDTQPPSPANCPPDQAVVLDASGNGVFSIVDPTVTDNCTIASTELIMTFTGGATDKDGMTSFTTTNLMPLPILYTVKGAGSVNLEYTSIDAAGNISKCSSIVTVVGAGGPCLNDVQAPSSNNCPQDQTFDLVNGEVPIMVTVPDFADNCAVTNIKAVITYRGGVTNPSGETDRVLNNIKSGFSGEFKLVGAGKTTFEFIATDPSGNESRCIATYTTVIPGTNALFNVGSACAVAGQNISLPVTVTRFNAIGAFSFDLEVQAGSSLSFVGLDNEALENVSYNILGNGDLRVAWDEPSGNNLTLEDNYRIFNVVIAADASFSTPSPVTGKDLVLLSDINDVGSINIGNICFAASVTPLGKILSPETKAHAGVSVNLLSGENVAANTSTDAQGGYNFNVTNQSYRIRPSKNDAVRKGVTIADVARIRRHFLQKLFLQGDYKLVAADVNKDGRINVLDVAYTNRVFLRKRDDFPNNTSWRFIPKAVDISANPLDANIPEQINLLAPNLDYNNLDFVSIKTGDVDHSSLNNLRGTIGSSRLDVSISIPDTVLSPQEMVEIPVYLSGADRVSALSFEMKYDNEVLELVSISAPNLPGFSGGSYNDIDGDVLIGWDHPQGDDVDAEGTLMMMTFTSKVTEGKSDITVENATVLDINLDEIGVTSQSGSVDFMISNVKDIDKRYQVIASPNPFLDMVNLTVEVNTPQPISVTFTDVSGRVLKQMDIKSKRANHQISVNDLDARGVIIVLVKGDDFSETLRLIKL